MCDYSLEVYGSRPAREGERYVTSRFPSGTMGLASPGDPKTAVCLQCDTKLTVEDIPAVLQAKYGVGEKDEAVFTRLDTGSYRDGIMFSNGRKCSFQEIPPGVTVSVKTLLENEKVAAWPDNRVLERI